MPVFDARKVHAGDVDDFFDIEEVFGIVVIELDRAAGACGNDSCQRAIFDIDRFREDSAVLRRSVQRIGLNESLRRPTFDAALCLGSRHLILAEAGKSQCSVIIRRLFVRTKGGWSGKCAGITSGPPGPPVVSTDGFDEGTNVWKKRVKDQHFVPVFYLKKWIVAPETKLVAYARRSHGPVTGRWIGPKGTGFEPHLYDAKDGSGESLETSFLDEADSKAAVAMENFFGPGPDLDWERPVRSAWTRFILTMLMRHPEDLATFRRMLADDWTNLNDEMREAYLRERTPDQPETAEEWWEQNRAGYMEKATQRVLRTLMDHSNIGATINAMAWSTAKMEASRFPLLTSDRPVLLGGKLNDPDAFIMMPISPTRLFIAVRRDETLALIRRWPVDELATEVNREVVGRAERFVFASNRSQDRFIQNRMGTQKVRTIFQDLEDRRAADRAGLLAPAK